MHAYPKNYDSLGKLRWWRLKIVALYFLAIDIRGRSRSGTPIELFLLQMINDLRFCHKFPWRHYTFDDSLKEIKHMVKPFRGKILAKASWTFHGFINPLDEILIFLEPIGSELGLLEEIFDEGLWDDFELGDDMDNPDPITDGWNRIIIIDRVKILWEDLYTMDVQIRKEEHESERICEEAEGPRVCEETEAGCESLETRLTKLIKKELKVRDAIIAELEAIIKTMEDDRNPRDRFGNMDDLFDHDHFSTGGMFEGQENDGEEEPKKEGDIKLKKDGKNEPEKEGENELEKDGKNEPGKEGENELEKEHEKEGENELDKAGENEPEQLAEDDADKEAVEDDAEKESIEKVKKEAAEKEATDDVDEDPEKDSPEDAKALTMLKKVPKPSHLKQSPYVEK
ncbi:hypothetical protein N665_1431s0003 [Sinapis alba]|nr:hypothetical protein N665_1431s0003 [Sinapis alba]